MVADSILGLPRLARQDGLGQLFGTAVSAWLLFMVVDLWNSVHNFRGNDLWLKNETFLTEYFFIITTSNRGE
jgi:hypothetical protein